jgi:protoheme IX farnesyltransferase
MSRAEVVYAPSIYRTISNYIDVLKPRETILLTLIGLCAAYAAFATASGNPSADKFALAFVAILIGSGGVNGLTNYLDRDLDAKMQRTCQRSLPALRITPPERILPFAGGLVVIGLVLAWFLSPLCFAVGLIGTVVAVTYRKRASCTFPQGTIAGCSPVLIGWLAFDPTFSLDVVFLCVLIGVWIPLHVWSVMVARREEYVTAGIGYFPISWQAKDAVKVLLGLSFVLYAASLGVYFVMGLGPLFLAVANILGIMMVAGSAHLVGSKALGDAWRLYKLSSFPYLGLIFLAICLDLWLIG